VLKKIQNLLGIKAKASREPPGTVAHNKYVEYLRGGPNETWPQAVDRFASFSSSLHEFVADGETHEAFFDEYFQDGTLFEQFEPVTDVDLQGAEAKHAFVMPAELKELYRRRFAIYDVTIERGRWGGRRVLEIYGPSPSTSYACLHAFCPAIAWNFGGYFARQELTDAQVAHLDANYFCFGRWSDDDHEGTYLLVDRHGNFGRYDFHTEDYPRSVQRLEPLLNGSPLTMTLDEVLVWGIDSAMDYLLYRNDVPSPHEGAV
jgi:hypothetical protein